MSSSYKLITWDEKSMDFFKKESNKIASNHLIIKLSNNINISKEKILLFLELANLLKKNGMSFVVVQSGIDVELYPEELNLVPTLQEAEDIIEMENIERDLGF